MPRTKLRASDDRAPDGRRLYSLGDVTSIVGVSRAQAQYWLKHRLLVADYPASGTGNFSGLTFRNLIEFELLRRLSWLGVSTVTMRHGLIAVRLVDPDDWYASMPGMVAAIEALPKKRRPTKKQGLKWMSAGGDHEIVFTDAASVSESEAYFEAVFGPNDVDPQQTPEDAEKLHRWREFKDPRSRSSDTLLVIGGATGFLVFPSEQLAFSDEYGLYRYVHKGVPAIAMSLQPVFDYIEKRTNDHWNNVSSE